MTRQPSTPLVHQSLSETIYQACDLAQRVQRGDMDLAPPYQRGEKWTTAQQVGLVKSWLLGLPIPKIIINDRTLWPETRTRLQHGRMHYAVIDGKQRLLAAVAWFSGELLVPADWFPADAVTETEDIDGNPHTRFTGLTREAQARMELRAPLETSTAHVATVEEEAAIYLLVNGAGTSQTAEDLARAAEIAHPAEPGR